MIHEKTRGQKSHAAVPLSTLFDSGTKYVYPIGISLKKAQYSTAQYSTVQYGTVHYSTVQFSTAQYSTVPERHDEVSEANERTVRICKETDHHVAVQNCHGRLVTVL